MITAPRAARDLAEWDRVDCDGTPLVWPATGIQPVRHLSRAAGTVRMDLGPHHVILHNDDLVQVVPVEDET